MRGIYRKLTVVTLIGALFVAGCSASKPKEASQASASQLTVGITNPPLMFNPIDSDGSGSSGAVFTYRYFFDSLVKTVGPLEYKMMLAESFKTSDNQTFSIAIHPKANWTDGKPVTAQDVEFTLNLIASPKTVTTQRSAIFALAGLNEKGMLPEGETKLSSVKVVDDKHLEIKTSKPVDPNLIYERFSDVLIVPKHILENVDPAQLNQQSFWRNPNVTSGAYKFVKYENKSYVELAANESYYRGAPKIQKVFIKIMPAANIVAQLQSGELDMNAAQGTGNIPASEWKTVKTFPNLRTEEQPTRRYNSVEINTERFPDKRVRQALAYAIDRKMIVDQLMPSAGELQNGPYSNSHPYHDKNVKSYGYEPEKAKQLLKEAGFDMNKTIELIVPTGDKTREMAGNIIQQNFQAIGLKVKQVNFDFPTTVSRLVKGDFDLALSSFGSIMDPDGPANVYRSTAALNDMRFKNKRVDELFNLGMNETDKEKRFTIYSELQNMIQEEVPLITIFSEYNLMAVAKSVDGKGGVMDGMHYDVNGWTRK
ncbi:ABC transporter substrate-binding protein [Paenibacillus allorhizosphaerae]|uniref:Oligopeptide-binding protein AppA n=1 Tax=Paenibacillus allorhizosphaerae TaxID=2849866 RepID=A0ABM8VLI5_9BACL|nr:ABC transporter substrate-binding protein [Paenibacillus allorhizosphaerae]CAG7648625.1 Oligopeptide-binding protein AppA [Paenibacillus allorhizosphaerae]